MWATSVSHWSISVRGSAANCSRQAAVSAGTTSFRSPTIGMSAVRILEISAGSMSTWMTAAWRAKVSGLPVTRSSKRAPRVMIRSARWREPTAATVPCMPGIPRLSWWSVGSTSRAVSVVVNGAPTSSTSSLSCSTGTPARLRPPPR